MRHVRRHSKEVNRDHRLDVVLQDGPPGLRRRLAVARHVLPHAGLADIDAELEQFAVNTRRPPQWILAAQSTDQFSNVFRYRWSAGLAVTNFPCPEQTEALAMPGNHGFRFDDYQSRSPVVPNLAQPCPEEPIGWI